MGSRQLGPSKVLSSLAATIKQYRAASAAIEKAKKLEKMAAEREALRLEKEAAKEKKKEEARNAAAKSDAPEKADKRRRAVSGTAPTEGDPPVLLAKFPNTMTVVETYEA